MKIKACRSIALAFTLLLGTPLWAADGYRPVVLFINSSPPETPEPLSGSLIGAYKDGKWYEPTDLPIKVNGKTLTKEAVRKLSGDLFVCVTPLLAKGEKLAFYSADGGKPKTEAVTETKFGWGAETGSDEQFIIVETKWKDLAAPMTVGVAEGWQAVTAPTRRSTDKEGNIVFSLESSNPPLSVIFSLVTKGQKIYKAALIVGKKKIPLTEVDTTETETLEGFFIDVNGNGQPEFVLYTGSSFEVYDLGPNLTNPKRVLFDSFSYD